MCPVFHKNTLCFTRFPVLFSDQARTTDCTSLRITKPSSTLELYIQYTRARNFYTFVKNYFNDDFFYGALLFKAACVYLKRFNDVEE